METSAYLRTNEDRYSEWEEQGDSLALEVLLYCTVLTGYRVIDWVVSNQQLKVQQNQLLVPVEHNCPRIWLKFRLCKLVRAL